MLGSQVREATSTPSIRECHRPQPGVWFSIASPQTNQPRKRQDTTRGTATLSFPTHHPAKYGVLPMGMGLFLPPPHGWTKIPLFPPYIPPHSRDGRTQTLFTLRINHCYSSP
jgi:hypothetical protein